MNKIKAKTHQADVLNQPDASPVIAHVLTPKEARRARRLGKRHLLTWPKPKSYPRFKFA